MYDAGTAMVRFNEMERIKHPRMAVLSYPFSFMHVRSLLLQNQFSTAPAASGGANVASMARMRLGPRLATHTPVFFPLNPGVMAVAGPTAARVLVIEKLLGAQRLHQVCVWVTCDIFSCYFRLRVASHFSIPSCGSE